MYESVRNTGSSLVISHTLSRLTDRWEKRLSIFRTLDIYNDGSWISIYERSWGVIGVIPDSLMHSPLFGYSKQHFLPLNSTHFFTEKKLICIQNSLEIFSLQQIGYMKQKMRDEDLMLNMPREFWSLFSVVWFFNSSLIFDLFPSSRAHLPPGPSPLAGRVRKTRIRGNLRHAGRHLQKEQGTVVWPLIFDLWSESGRS